MKKMFPGHFALTDDECSSLWDSALIVPDTNVLLNLYRYTPKTSDEFMSVLSDFSSALWLPFRVAEEFFDRRASVISGQAKKIDDVLKKLESVHEELNPKGQHPLLDLSLSESFTEIKEKVCIQLKEGYKKQRDLIVKDSILLRVASLFQDEKVGPDYDGERIKSLLRDGAARYKEKIPPGYKDADKGGGSGHHVKAGKNPSSSISNDGEPKAPELSLAERCRPYGDFIIWTQLIDKASEAKKNIIFITADAKEDWWNIQSGLTVGPRPELIKEFRERSGQSLILYSPDSFLLRAKKKGQDEITLETISEVEELARIDADNLSDLDKTRVSYSPEQLSRAGVISMDLHVLNNHKDHLQYKMDSFTQRITRVYAELATDGSGFGMSDSERANLEVEKETLHGKCMDLMNQIRRVDADIFNLEVEMKMLGR